MPPRHEANIPVGMLSGGASCHPSDLAIEPRILEPAVIAARMLLSEGHKETVECVCNYCSRLNHVTGAEGGAVGPSGATSSVLGVS